MSAPCWKSLRSAGAGPISPDEDCLRCGLCEAHCPVLAARADFPGPKALGPDAGRQRRLGAGIPEPALGECLYCGTCERVCPQGLSPWRTSLAAKTALVSESGLGATDRLLTMIPALGPAASALAPLVNLGLSNRPLWRLAARLTGIDPDFDPPLYQRPRFRDWLRSNQATATAPAQDPSPGAGTDPPRRAALFGGCVNEFNDRSAGAAAVKILRAAGVAVEVPDAACCGLPARVKGSAALARKRAERNLALLDDLIFRFEGPLLFLSPSCLLMVKEAYPLLVDSEAARLLAKKSRGIESFLHELLEGAWRPTLSPVPGRLAYQTPCHLRLLTPTRPGLSLLSLIPDLEVTDIDQGCCGLGGTHGLSADNAPASFEIGQRLGRALTRGAYDGVVSECEACRMRLSNLSGLRAKHPLEVLAESLGAP